MASWSLEVSGTIGCAVAGTCIAFLLLICVIPQSQIILSCLKLFHLLRAGEGDPTRLPLLFRVFNLNIWIDILHKNTCISGELTKSISKEYVPEELVVHWMFLIWMTSVSSLILFHQQPRPLLQRVVDLQDPFHN